MFYIKNSNSKKNILIVTPTFFPQIGGMSTSAYSFYLQALKDGYEPIVITSRLKNVGDLEKRKEFAEDNGITILEVPFLQNIGTFISLIYFILFYRTKYNRLEYVHSVCSYSSSTFGYIISKIFNTKFIMSVQGYLFSEMWKNTRWSIIRKMYFYKRSFFLLNKCNFIHVDGIDLKTYLYSYGIQSDKINVLPNLNIKFNSSKKVNDQNKLEQIGFLFVSRFEERLGAYDCILSYKMYLEKSQVKQKLTMIGNGEEFTKVKKYIDDNHLNEYVSLLGNVDINLLDDYFSNALVYLMPIKWCGGYPQVLIQALKLCDNIIAYKTNFAAYPFYKHNITYVENFNVSEFAQAMTKYDFK